MKCMLHPIFSKAKDRMDPIPEWTKRLWNAWDVRVLILLSLALQIILSVFGSRRKSTTLLLIRAIVWCAYLTADSVATFALGKLSAAQVSSDPNQAMVAIWAPMLLLHLGGPDTITAYAMEDNKLWLRHLLGLIVQVTLSVYAILLSWKGSSWLSFLTLPVFVAGTIKYGERTWALKSTIQGHSPDIKLFSDDLIPISMTGFSADNEVVKVAHYALSLFRPHFDGYLLDENSSEYVPNWFDSYNKWCRDSPGLLWKVFEIEMGFIYDLLYTKANILRTKKGCILRAISFSCTLCASIAFFLLTFGVEKSSKHGLTVDIIITGGLLVAALLLEIHAIAVAFSSDSMVLWLSRRHQAPKLVSWFFQNLPNLSTIDRKRRWSNSMGQFNLLTLCLKSDSNMWIRKSILSLCRVEEKFSMYQHKTCTEVPPYLKNLIISYVSVASSKLPREAESYLRESPGGLKILALPLESHKQPFNTSGERTLKWFEGEKVLEGIMRAEFGERIYILYIVTKMLLHGKPLSGEVSAVEAKILEALSEYMVYLLFISPSMLPVTWDTYSPTKRSFAIEKSLSQLRVIIQNDSAVDERGAGKLLYEALVVLGENLRVDDMNKVCILLEQVSSILKRSVDSKEDVDKKLREALQILAKRNLEQDQDRAFRYVQEACDLLAFLQDQGRNKFLHQSLDFVVKVCLKKDDGKARKHLKSAREFLYKFNFDRGQDLDQDHIKHTEKLLLSAAYEDIEEAITILRTSSSSGHEASEARQFSNEVLERFEQLVKGRQERDQLLVTIAETLHSLRKMHVRGRQSWLEFLRQIWLEVLCYAAKECPQNNHLGQLRRGGELLSLVWLLINQRYPSNRSMWWTMDLQDNLSGTRIWNEQWDEDENEKCDASLDISSPPLP